MKTLVIPDLHGKAIWSTLTNRHEVDKVVFLGDYFDERNHGISVARQIHNFKDILSFKDVWGDDVILLMGNHDIHYLSPFLFEGETATGFNKEHKWEICKVITDNLSDLMACYIQDNYIFSHAGITKTWLENQMIPQDENIEFNINAMFQEMPLRFRFNGVNFTGDDVTQGPMWVRPKSLRSNRIPGIHIVGHTRVPYIDIDNSDGIIITDTLDTSKEYITIEDGAIEIHRV